MANEEAVAFGFLLIGLGIALVFYLVVVGFVCWLLSGWLAKIPPEHRKVEPGKVWLLMIPLFQLVWNFFVFPPMAESFDACFRSKNEPAESALGLAKVFCWVNVGAFVGGLIPCLSIFLGPLGGLATLVLLILVLVKFHALKEKVVAGTK